MYGCCYHVNEGDVDEHAANGGEDPGGRRADVADEETDEHADQSQERRQQVVEDGLLGRHARPE